MKMGFSCTCGKLKKKWADPGIKQICPLCQTGLTRQSSLNQFFKLSEDHLSGRRKQVLEAIKELIQPNNREIAEHLNLPINCITGRVKELRDMNLVDEEGKKKDTKTKTTTTTWRTI